jgi:hypothetical protein
VTGVAPLPKRAGRRLITQVVHWWPSWNDLTMRVFVSYTREDQARVLRLVEGLRLAGLTVGWDRDIVPGARWRRALEEQIDSAACVIVVWSTASAGAAGDFVHDEASRAKARSVLLPVRIDAVDEPLGFGEIHSLDLVDWTGEADDPRFRQLVASVKAIATGDSIATPEPEPRPSAKGLVAWLGRLLPTYVADLVRITSGPKRFLAARTARHPVRWQDGFVFVAMSLLVTSAIYLPFEPHPVRAGVAELVFVVLFGYAAYFAWRAVGARPRVEPVLMIHFYLAGVLQLILTATLLVALGALRFGDAASYDELVRASDVGSVMPVAMAIAERPAGRLLALVAVAGNAVMLAWIVIGWSAYRRLTGVGRLRSTLAFAVFLALCLPVYVGVSVVAAALVR